MVEISPDEIVFWKWGFVSINETIVFTWAVMALLVFLAWFTTRRLSVEPPISRWQNLFETLIGYMNSQIRGIAQMDPGSLYPLLWHFISFYFDCEFARHCPWLPYANQFSIHYGCTGNMRLLCSSHLRNCPVGHCRLSQALR